LATSKTKEFCKIASIFEIDSIQNEAILRAYENGNLSAELTRFAIFQFHPSKVLPLPRKSEARSYEVLQCAAPVTQNHLGKPEDPMRPNAAPLMKSAP